ncbi:ABC transporter ATP-binding protein [Streptococcus saliviloxodontae]|uniref:ABC-2 type transport system ATP-binding protein n=1 Tax=Streptococcus saliviloxodontae TaxID=1349416 RepID=A0ABS2PJQ5_9STRE|nr:ABC transporter ATP-binding protein [Streptococcus saliviloxodontae]MBM7635658.1 ABC-2 type transport system ATP-binding protein [Streptococcus saliviloxodontae]
MKEKKLLRVENLSVSFGKFTALKTISLSISQNDGVIGLIGQNGAGKTTLIHSVLQLTKPISGIIETYNTKIAYCPDTPEFPDDLSAKEVLYYSAWISELPKPSKDTVMNLLSVVGLNGYENKVASSFSRGMKQRLGIAASLILKPELLFLDEPTSALDPFGREEILDIIKGISKQTTVVISTHNLADVQKVADKLFVINRGNLLYSGSLIEFLGQEELSFIELFSAVEVQRFIELLKQNNIEVFNPKEEHSDNRLYFSHSDFPKVLASIDENLAIYVKSCNNREFNLYEAFYRAVKSSEGDKL